MPSLFWSPALATLATSVRPVMVTSACCATSMVPVQGVARPNRIYTPLAANGYAARFA